MNGYTKLFGSILASTIWRESKETKVLWITMLAMADRSGHVMASTPGLADLARLTLAETEAALEVLLAPDAYSRTKEFEGRRVEAIDGGWVVLNHQKYRDKMSAEDRKEKNAEYQRQSRARRQQNVSTGQQMSAPVSAGQAGSALSPHADADADADAKKGKMGTTEAVGPAVGLAKPPDPDPRKKKPPFVPPSIPEVAAYCFVRKNNIDPELFVAHYTANGWVQAKGKPILNWKAAVVTWEKNGIERGSSGGTTAPKPADIPQLVPPT